jgi:hypothetical protein
MKLLVITALLSLRSGAYAKLVHADRQRDAGGIRFSVGIDPKLVTSPGTNGRVIVVLKHQDARGRRTSGETEPRDSIGATGMDAPPMLATDVLGFTADRSAFLDQNSALFPIASLHDLPTGEYSVQAVFHSNRDINLHDAPGNLYSKAQTVKLDPTRSIEVKLVLTERIPDEVVPRDTDTKKYLKFPSRLLSDFHHRPMFYRASVVLPANFEHEPDKKYLLCVHIGGFGTRYDSIASLESDPRFVQLLLDGAGPYGDPYQVNSANNGPYGDALTEELIPYVEKMFRCGGPGKRFTEGVSTGGWVSLALQIFYPDFFNGCWSSCPDSVDFRCYELINIYDDPNAYVNRWGFERPAKRNVDGDCVYTVRHECQVENVLGLGDRWQLSGKDWCSWNATYGPRGEDGLPKPLWNPKTGEIDRRVTEHWKKYDLRLVLENNWSTLGPKLAGKLHVWAGDADDYYLNNSVHHLKRMLESQQTPRFEGEITISMRQPHGFGPNISQIFDAMAARGN